MSTDIHGFVDVKDKGKWKTVIDITHLVGGSYRTFGRLFGVRSSQHQFDDETGLFGMRGLPDTPEELSWTEQEVLQKLSNYKEIYTVRFPDGHPAVPIEPEGNIDRIHMGGYDPGDVTEIDHRIADEIDFQWYVLEDQRCELEDDIHAHDATHLTAKELYDVDWDQETNGAVMCPLDENNNVLCTIQTDFRDYDTPEIVPWDEAIEPWQDIVETNMNQTEQVDAIRVRSATLRETLSTGWQLLFFDLIDDLVENIGDPEAVRLLVWFSG